jgi:hypothetical protein
VSLECCHAGETGHGKEVEEDLQGVEYDGWFWDDHLEIGLVVSMRRSGSEGEGYGPISKQDRGV